MGSFHAIEDSVTYALYRRGWTGFAFDPSSEAERSFRRFRPRDKFVRSMIGETNEEIKSIWIPKNARSDLSRGTTLYPDILENYRETSASISTLSAFCKDQSISHVNFMNLDVEGAEMDVLRGINFGELTIDVLAVEIHGNQLERGLVSEVSQFLAQNGYVAVASTVITYFFVRRDITCL